MELDEIITGEEIEEKDSVEKRLLMMNLPNVWNVHHAGNMEIEMESDFAKFMFAVSEHTNQDISEITVFNFYALLEYIKEKNTKNK